MDLRDLLLGIDVVGHVSIQGDQGDVASCESDLADDEEYIDGGSPMQVLQFPQESQHSLERAKLPSCVVKQVPLTPTPAEDKKQPVVLQEKKYPCRYCGEKFSTNYMLGNHVSRKHRHLSKIFKPQKPAKVQGEGQATRKRGRPRKYPLTADSTNKPSTHSSSQPQPICNDYAYPSNTKHADSSSYNRSEQNERDVGNKLTMVMDILHEFEATSQPEKHFRLFEQAPLFTSRLVALRALLHARELGLISTVQYLGKQEEFLHSFVF